MLPKKKDFVLQIGEIGTWVLGTDALAEELEAYTAIKKANEGNIVTRKTRGGRSYDNEKMAPYVNIDPKRMKRLGESLASLIEDATTEQKIAIVSKFVQALPYKLENGVDNNRPPLATIFNGGGDCNNKLILWSSILTALKINHAILNMPPKPRKVYGHVLGAVPERYLDNCPTGRVHEGHRMIELTIPYPMGDDPTDGDEILFMEKIEFGPDGEMITEVI
jgi:hypothetical protein